MRGQASGSARSIRASAGLDSRRMLREATLLALAMVSMLERATAGAVSTVTSPQARYRRNFVVMLATLHPRL
jgi:hypothetical protein